jgi:hypothetical protein
MSWQASLVLIIDEKLRERIKACFRDSGIKFTETISEEKDAPFILNIYGQDQEVLKPFVSLYTKFKDKMKGHIQYPDNRVCELNDSNIEIITQGSKQPIISTTSSGTKSSFWELYQPEIRDLIKELPDIITWYPETSARQNIRITVTMIAFLFGVLLITAYLASSKLISGDAIIFLIGSIVGYVFAFLQKYLGIFAEH